MCSGLAVQTKGLGSALVSARKRLIATYSSTGEPNTPRLSRRLVNLAKKPSTALSHEAEVGVKGKVQRGIPLEPGQPPRVLVGAVVVEDGVDELAGRHRRHDRFQTGTA